MKTITEMFWSYLVIVGGFYWFWRKDLFTAGHLKSLYRIATVLVVCSNLYIFNSKAYPLKDFSILPITSVVLITSCYLGFAFLFSKIYLKQERPLVKLVKIVSTFSLPILALAMTVFALTIIDNKRIEEAGKDQQSLIDEIRRLSHFVRVSELVNSKLHGNLKCGKSNIWSYDCLKNSNQDMESRALASTLKTIVLPVIETPDTPPLESNDKNTKETPPRLLINMAVLTALPLKKQQELFIRLDQLAKHPKVKVIPDRPTNNDAISDPEFYSELYDPLGVDISLEVSAKESSNMKIFWASMENLSSSLLAKLIAPSQAGVFLGELLLVVLIILMEEFLYRHKPDAGSPPINTTDDDDMNIPHS